MKKIRRNLLFISVMLIMGLLLIPNVSVGASANLVPSASSNIRRYVRRYSSLVSVSNGYMRVFYDKTNKNVGVEYYDENFNITKKNKIALELPIYGGFYAGKDAYYLVEGQNNEEENTSKEVIRVIKYDKNWKRIGAAKIVGDSAFAHEIRYPFDYGSTEMVEVDGKLYIATGHEGYVDDAVGQGHQGMLLIEVNENTLQGRLVDADLWHSFAQYIDYKGDNLYLLEQSEGSRATYLTKYDKTDFKGVGVPVLEYGGSRTSAWAVSCYASVDGLAISSNNVLGIGTSIDQEKYDEARTAKLPHNIYLTVTPTNNFSKDATIVKWLTNYTDESHAFTGLEITKINDNRFLVSWSEYQESKDIIDVDSLSTNVLHYVFIDGNGNKIGNEFTAQATISNCKPIVKSNKVVYYASNGAMVDFYTIDATTGKLNKVMYRVAGDNATWSVSNGTLTISGSGAMAIDTGEQVQFPLSSTLGGYSYSSGDNAWKPIKGIVNKIVIGEGITSIQEQGFTYFGNVTQVTLPKTLKTIGKEAFKGCNALRKIFIPTNVTSMGTDVFWTGAYWSGSGEKAVYATVYTPVGSYAESWAKKNNISYVNANSTNPITGVTLNKTSLSLATGKTEKLTATINPSDTLDSKTLTWTSSNTKVATVDANGNVKAISVGTANITVKTSNGKTAVAKVTVTAQAVTQPTAKPTVKPTNKVVAITSVKINQSSLTLITGKTSKLTATINPSNTTQSKTLTWISSNTKIATVDKNGVVKGIKAGTVNI
ncbi:MAG: Ig-like domain-containing protein, partial [Bacilli bacterium]|nr:Ig-like domain-containing protein [Bacilli bacterium]